MKNNRTKTISDTSDGKLNGYSIFLQFSAAFYFFYLFRNLVWVSLPGLPLFLFFMALRDAATIRQSVVFGFYHRNVSLCRNHLLDYLCRCELRLFALYLGIILMLLLACYLSLYFALFAGGIVYLRRRSLCILPRLFLGLSGVSVNQSC